MQTAPANAKFVRYLKVRPVPFGCIWLVIWVLHAFCAFYFVSAGVIYRRIPGSVTELMLDGYSIGMPAKNYPIVAAVQFFFAAIHCFMGLLMVAWSLYKRRWSFGPIHDQAAVQRQQRVGSLAKRFSSILGGRVKDASDTGGAPPPPPLPRWLRVLRSMIGRDGVFGVSSPYFDQIIAVREIIETSLQTQQAYTMSRSLARPWLNRFYVATLVFNCWSVPLMNAVYRDRVMFRRLAVLLLDATLDLLSSIGVSALLMLSYSGDFDPSIWSFSPSFWFNDQQFVAALTEFPIMLTTSWGDLLRQIVFCFGLLMCLEDVKDVLCLDSTKSTTVLDAAMPKTNANANEESTSAVVRAKGTPGSATLRVMLSFRRVHSHVQRRLLQVVEFGFVLLGTVVLALHLKAESVPHVTQCLAQLRPWAESSPACALIHVDCARDGHDGAASKVTEQWKRLHPSYVRRTVVTHCPAFEMPSLHQSFALTKAVKMFNTTVASWDLDAALTATANPHVVLAYFFRVNVSGGVLPDGLMAPDFPPLLIDIIFCVSNLRSIPDAMGTRWNAGGWFNCNYCQLTAFPRAFKSWQAYLISLSQNPLTDFPWEAFANKGLVAFENNGNAVRSFAPDPYDERLFATSDLGFVTIVGSNVTYLPRWVDVFLAHPRDLWFMAPLDLSLTPFCEALQSVRAGTRQRFPAELTSGLRPEQLSDLMYVTSENVSALDPLVTCSSTVTVFIDATDDDKQYAISA
ncbi:hypothetical protein PINS_up015213 [Pythium insidiosum]|nr:hypothetical protein PINS_up015213 [Pythium insidiosum]